MHPARTQLLAIRLPVLAGSDNLRLFFRFRDILCVGLRLAEIPNEEPAVGAPE